MASFASPTATQITDVNFGHLNSDEIKQISVKRIHVTPTLDSFHNPTPGGLYDPALGCILDKMYGLTSVQQTYLANMVSDAQLADCHRFPVLVIAVMLSSL